MQYACFYVVLVWTQVFSWTVRHPPVTARVFLCCYQCCEHLMFMHVLLKPFGFVSLFSWILYKWWCLNNPKYWPQHGQMSQLLKGWL